MKKYLSLAAAAALMAVSCSKNVQGGQAPGIDDDNASPEAIVFGSNVIAVKSKANGGVDEWNASQTLYIYGYDREVTDFTAAAYIDNVDVASPASGMSGAINVYEDKASSKPYYYSGKTKYDFYGYYVDDAAGAAPAPVKETDRIYIPFTIDGGQDLMIAKADQGVDIAGSEITDPDLAYSAYSARRKVHPTLKFEHQLSRFVFDVIGGGDNYANISVAGITITSKTTGKLVVAGDVRGIEDAADEKVLYLKEKDASGRLVALGSNGAFVPSREASRIGESLLVIPGEDEYKLTVNLVQDGISAKDEYAIRPSMVVPQVAAFEKGKQYKVTVTIYGLEDVRITAELTAWDQSGDIVLDPDDPATW